MLQEYTCYIDNGFTDGYSITSFHPIDAAIQYTINYMCIDYTDQEFVTVKVMDDELNLYHILLRCDDRTGFFYPI